MYYIQLLHTAITYSDYYNAQNVVCTKCSAYSDARTREELVAGVLEVHKHIVHVSEK